MRLKLTDISVANLKFQHPQYTAWDILMPSFGCRVGSKTKTFVIMTGKHRKRVTLGHYPKMSLKQARVAARLKLQNPLAIPEEQSSTSAAVTKYLDAIDVKDRTHRDYTRLLKKHLVGTLGNRRVEDITTRDILSITDGLLKAPQEARHAHAAIGTFFSWCVPRYLPVSPMAGLKSPAKPNERDRVLTDDELKAVWKAAGALGNYGVVVKLICLLALRKSEPVGPKSINETTATFLDTKSGYSHTMPITPYARELLQKVHYTNGWSKNFERLKQLSGTSGYTLHDMRRSAASKFKCPPWLTERILGHRPPKLERIYNHYDFTEDMRKPLEEHENYLLKLVEDS
jgi:hypothetical protein